MFFVISKIFWFVVEPATFLVLLGLLAVILIFSGFARTGRRLLIGLTLVFAFLVLTPVAVLFIRPLEERFPRPPADMPPPAGIIVLGGGLNGLLSQARDEPILVGGGSRLTTGVELARRYPQAPL
ncbi:MAG TPA: YdcF family protein, partial [Beijerinckia sp.]|nr:YdcF family protein [Beijerinckia sp.]